MDEMRVNHNVFQRALRKVISWAVNFTPNVFYYSGNLETYINDELRRIAINRYNDDSDDIMLTNVTAMVFLTGVSKDLVKVGDSLTTTMHQVVVGNDVGSFRIHVERIAEE